MLSGPLTSTQTTTAWSRAGTGAATPAPSESG